MENKNTIESKLEELLKMPIDKTGDIWADIDKCNKEAATGIVLRLVQAGYDLKPSIIYSALDVLERLGDAGDKRDYEMAIKLVICAVEDRFRKIRCDQSNLSYYVRFGEYLEEYVRFAKRAEELCRKTGRNDLANQLTSQICKINKDYIKPTVGTIFGEQK